MIGFFLFICFVIKVVAKSLIVVAILIGMIFFPFIILLTIGRFFIDARLRRRTFYGLTNKRIIIKSDKFPKVFRSIYLDAQLKVEFLPNPGDTSTIDLGIQQPPGGGRAGGVGWSPNGKSYASLYRLPDGNFVHKKIRELLKSIDKTAGI